MIEKILKETYVNPKVDLTLNDYNRLVSMATMKAKKIEERAREIYEKEGVVKIEFDGRFVDNSNGVRETENYRFDVSCKQYNVNPTGEFVKTLFSIPQEMRQRIATKVKRYVEEVFVAHVGEQMFHLNAIVEAEEKTERQRRKFLIWTVTGWLVAVLMFFAILFK